MSRDEITESMQDLFAIAYLRHGRNGAAAYRECFPGRDKDASQGGRTILNRPGMRDRIDALVRRKAVEIDCTHDRLLHEYAAVAFLDFADILDEDGAVRDLSDMEPQARRAIAGIDVEHKACSDGDVATVKKIKISDKLHALDSIAKMQGYLKDRVEHSGEVSLVSLLDADLRPASPAAEAMFDD